MNPPPFAARLRTMQIIVGAILMGLVTATAIMVVLVAQNGAPRGQPNNFNGLPLVTIIMAGLFAVCFIARLFVVRATLRSAIERAAAVKAEPAPDDDDPLASGDATQLLAARQTTIIVSCAMLEGPGLGAAIAYMIEGQPFALLIVLAAAVGIALQFPTRERIRNWLEYHLALVAELRQLGSAFDIS
jgi:hypothetical protein